MHLFTFLFNTQAARAAATEGEDAGGGAAAGGGGGGVGGSQALLQFVQNIASLNLGSLNGDAANVLARLQSEARALVGRQRQQRSGPASSAGHAEQPAAAAATGATVASASASPASRPAAEIVAVVQQIAESLLRAKGARCESCGCFCVESERVSISKAVPERRFAASQHAWPGCCFVMTDCRSWR